LFFRRKKKVLLALCSVLIILNCASLYALKTVEIGDRMKFSYPRIDQRYEKIQDFLKAVDHMIQNLPGFKALEKTVICYVVIAGTDIKDGYEISEKGGVLRIMLADDPESFVNNYKVQSAVLSTLLLCRYGINPTGNIGKVPGWMVSGFLCRAESRRISPFMPGLITYPATRALSIAMSEPDLHSILENPLDYSDGPAYQLYSEICAVLVEALTRFPGGGREVITSMLKASMADGNPYDSFRNSTAQILKKVRGDFPASPEIEDSDKLFEVWSKTIMRNGSVNIFFPGDSKFAIRRLESIEDVSYELIQPPAKDNDEKTKVEWRRCRMGELGNKWQEISNPEKTVLRLIRCMGEFSNQVPQMLQKDVNKLIISLKDLKEGDRDDFAGDYGKARKKFMENASALRQIEDYIAAGEKEFVPFGTRYSVELKYLDDAGSFAGRFWPSLESELERQQKKSR